MTLHHQTAVNCDQHSCKEWVVDEGTGARGIAKSHGWVLARRSGHAVDLCPAHALPVGKPIGGTS